MEDVRVGWAVDVRLGKADQTSGADRLKAECSDRRGQLGDVRFGRLSKMDDTGIL
jgi:hypothetical protein